MKKKWFTNEEVEIQLNENDPIPEGFRAGRKKVSEQTRIKHSLNNGIHKLTKEQLKERNKKISKTKQNKSPEEKALYSQHISKSKKGRHLSKPVWNKGKHLHYPVWNKGKHPGSN